MIKILLYSICAASTLWADTFSDLWYDGYAEISTFSLTEMRYGEPRTGTRTMVYVTEPLRIKTLIKPDSQLSSDAKIDVIKLNDIRKFNTGVYDYSVMTSVFSSVDKNKTFPLMHTVKTAFTSQEWCGTVFEQVTRYDDSYRIKLFSYFDSEGESTSTIPHNDRLDTEDNLWIRIRELRGSFLSENETKEISIIPSSWSRRKSHTPARPIKTYITKSHVFNIETIFGLIKAYAISWTHNALTTTVTLENAYPHRIISWQEGDGSKGRLIASERLPYWQQHKNSDLHLRDKLKL